MCGITGFVGYGGLSSGAVHTVALRMGEAIRHRGPDDSGIWQDAVAQVALVHRRLSILDLSPAGHQPMVSVSGRYVLVFNGEIYNHLDLRSSLENVGSGGAAWVGWRGHSDTETLLAGIQAWGLEETLRRSTGMFAIALWDRQERSLSLARDRMGEKPLYYGRQRGIFLFGSELKALKAHPAFENEINRDAIALQLRHNYIPAPYSIYQGIKKLPPGTILRLDSGALTGCSVVDDMAAKPYWSLADAVERGRADPFTGSDAEAVVALDGLLRAAVARQMVSDVPLGAFLSGGIDSSTIVALMQSQSTRPVKTFTIGFNEAGYNEAEHAKSVARHLGTEHTELYVTSAQARDVIPRLPALYDEPFSDASQIPTFLVSEMTRQHVTVSLSGDAGDELFGGYNRYLWAKNVNRFFGLPGFVRRAVVGGLTSLPPATWNKLFSTAGRVTPKRLRYDNPGDKIHKLAGLLGISRKEDIYKHVVSHWHTPGDVVFDASEPRTEISHPNFDLELAGYENRMMYLDAATYLPDDILVKVDRASMAVSLETRVPFLDHQIVEFACKLPLSLKIRHGQGKWILRQLLHNYVPQELIDRPKMGFGVPIEHWLRGPLRDWAESLLDESRLHREGFFNPVPIRQKWAEHLGGKRNWQYQLWNVLMFQAWLEAQRA